MKVPSADHPITIEASTARVRVIAGGQVVADTQAALTLRESDYPGVQYVPREDVDMSLLERSETTSYCPYKGEASYFSIPIGGERSVNAIWSYEEPYEAVAPIKGYLAFYPDRVDSIVMD